MGNQQLYPLRLWTIDGGIETNFTQEEFELLGELILDRITIMSATTIAEDIDGERRQQHMKLVDYTGLLRNLIGIIDYVPNPSNVQTLHQITKHRSAILEKLVMDGHVPKGEEEYFGRRRKNMFQLQYKLGNFLESYRQHEMELDKGLV